MGVRGALGEGEAGIVGHFFHVVLVDSPLRADESEVPRDQHIFISLAVANFVWEDMPTAIGIRANFAFSIVSDEKLALLFLLTFDVQAAKVPGSGDQGASRVLYSPQTSNCFASFCAQK